MASIRSSTVGDLVRRSARRDPERVALVFGERSWTYAALDEAAGRVACRLLELKLRKGDRVAEYGKNSDDYLILFLACGRLGVAHHARAALPAPRGAGASARRRRSSARSGAGTVRG
jgi:fatty-acyl-CoA synthase